MRVLILMLGAAGLAAQERRPEVLLADPAKLAAPMELKVIPSRSSSVYRAAAGEWQFNLHSYIAYHEGKFWAIWSSGRVDEYSPSQLIRYATSRGGGSRAGSSC